MAVNATAVWRVRPSGSNTNGGGYDPGISGAATDYSQQNSAQASGTHGSGAGTTTFTDTTAAAFTSAMVGNAINISGQGFYFVVTFTDSSHVVVDRALGTFSGASWALGGGWADFITNTTANVVPGNIIYILGSGTPNPSSYTYDYSLTLFTGVSGDTTNGNIVYANDPATPGFKAWPDTTGGMPVIKCTNGVLFNNFTYITVQGLYLVASSTSNGTLGLIRPARGSVVVKGCVFDQFGLDLVVTAGLGNSGQLQLIGTEVFSSVGAGAGSNQAVQWNTYFASILGCNIHDTIAGGLLAGGTNGAVILTNSIIAKCHGNGLELQVDGGQVSVNTIQNNTIDGNAGHGILLDTATIPVWSQIVNNIISNHTGAGKYGLDIAAGSTAVNTRLAAFIDYNTYYNNTSNYNAISAGAHDTALSSNPYVGQSTENYTLA